MASGPTRPRSSACRTCPSAMWHSPNSSSSRDRGSLTPVAKPRATMPQKPYFERLKRLKIGALPLAERGLQRRHRDQPERLEKACHAVWRDQCCGDGQQSETTPATHFQSAGSRREYRLGRQEQCQRQPEHKAAVQIGPQHHYRQQPERRPGPGVAGGEECPRPHHQERQGEQMGPRQQVTLHQCCTQGYRDQGRERLGPAQQKAGQESEADGKRRGGQQYQPAPPGEVIGGRQDDFGQPFVRHPGCAGERVGKRVVHRQSRVREHPATRGDMEIGVGVVEQRHRLSERAHEKDEPDDQRPGRGEFPERRGKPGESRNSGPDWARLVGYKACWVGHLWLAGPILCPK